MSPRSPRDPVEEDLRIQLEGTWEVLERARDRQGALLETLHSPFWLRRLRQRPELPRQVRELEAPLAEAIAHAERRLRTESAPEHHPLRLLLRRLHGQRARLERRIQERLEQRGDSRNDPLSQGLELLEAQLIDPPPWPPGQQEIVLLSGGTTGLMYLPFVLVFISLLFSVLARSPLPVLVSIPTLTILFIVGFNFRNTRRYWLTPQRLVWKRIVGGTHQLPLGSISTDGITWGHPLQPSQFILRVKGRRRVILANLEHLDLLNVLLRLHRDPLLRGRGLTPPTYPLASFPASRHPASGEPDFWAEPGLIVIRPGRVAFLLERNLDDILRTLFTSWPTEPPVGTSLQLLISQLCLLPAEDFDRLVEATARPHHGELWDAALVLHGPDPSGRGYQFARRQGSVLIGRPSASQLDLIGHLLASPARGVSPLR